MSVQDNIKELDSAACLMKFDETMRGLEGLKIFLDRPTTLSSIMGFLDECRDVTGLSHAAIVMLAARQSEKAGVEI